MSWALLGALVLVEIAYPLVPDRDPLVVATVLLGFALSVTHAWRTRGWRTAALLVAVTTGGGFAVEALGVATCVPFGCYGYSGALGPRPGGVSWVIPLAWTWMAWPAWLVAGRLVAGFLRVPLAGFGLAAWDVFLDPQMVAEGYWTWADPSPALPGVPGIPVGNYLGWLVVAVLMMAFLARVPPTESDDRPMYALYLWTYASSVLAHAVFLDLPGSALWGGVVMGLVAVPLGWRLWRS
ncbi:membrane protein [Virgisporangium aliadipatigenens]|uniref:Membrane protein n=1 Tax=Virgisporangium aliadipatigenens TaxID=741659 RepID=A0A8J3YU61_9ACTN|nr:carotenoid biosynthesis protein [Virgisporangium aliadipatigenens]GIJ49866.1 membrane protein [Virgisporangium aliadipatigenens]